MNEKQEIIIGESYDGFRLKHNNGQKEIEMFVDQEDNQAAKLSKFFEFLGYKVTIEEDF